MANLMQVNTCTQVVDIHCSCRCLLAEEEGVVGPTGHAGHPNVFQLLDVSGGRLVLEGTGPQLPTVVGTPSTHRCVCHGDCVVATRCYTPHVLHRKVHADEAKQASSLLL